MNAEGVEPGPGANEPSAEDMGPPRSHRRGMLAGLGAIGLLLAGLLVFGPGGTGPKPAARSQGGPSPVTIPVGSNAAAAGSSTTTTTVVPPAPTPKTGSVTDLAASTYQVRAPTPARSSTPTSTPAHVPTTTVPPSPPAATTTTTTAPAPPLTTTTTSPPVTTTTSCVLFLCD
jgi:hypothetical protein